MDLRDVVRTAVALFAPRTRRSWAVSERAHLELRALSNSELDAFEQVLEERLSELERVRGFHVNAHTRRVVIDFEPGAYDVEQLARVVESAERHLRLDDVAFPEQAGEHPADRQPEQRLLLELAADLLGVALGLGLKATFLPSSVWAARTAALANLVRSTEGLRGHLDRHLGRDRSDLALGLVAPVMLGLAQRPVAALVEVGHKLVLVREARARQRVWAERERELCQDAPRPSRGAREPFVRPVPLPGGPIEEYGDKAWVASLSGFLVSFATTRSFQRGFAALYGGLPRPARLGREAFAAELSAALSERGVLVLDAEALRRMDRVDCLVIDAGVIRVRSFELGEVLVRPPLTAALARRLAEQAFEPERSLAVHELEGYSLGPPRLLAAGLDDELAERARVMAVGGALVLGVARAGEVVGLVALRLLPRTGLEELIASAQRCGLKIVIATDDTSVLEKLDADDTITGGPAMIDGVRRLQREGRTVCLLSAGENPALALADVSVGLVAPGRPVPWGAHLIGKQGLDDTRVLIEAAAQARSVSLESVKVAIGAASLGALVSASGVVELTTSRVLAVVNGASLVTISNGWRTAASTLRRVLPAPRDRTPWHALEAEGVLRRLSSDPQQGLTAAEVSTRTPPRERPKSVLSELGESISAELFNPLAPLLAAGAALSAVVGSAADAGILGGVALVNAVLGGLQRFSVERAIQQLEQGVRRRALVRRDGRTVDVAAEALVKGDIVLLGPGDVVPADCRIITSESLEVDGSALTGESLPVRKGAHASFETAVADRSSMIFAGQCVAAGSATAVVVAVGDETEARRGVAAARAQHRIPSGVELRLKQLISQTGPVALGSAGAVVLAGLLRGRRLEDLIGTGVSLAVASMPEGLPLLASAAQRAAASRLAKRGALVRNLHGIEALGRVNVVCFDKTGTVTQGRIELALVSDGVVEERAEVLTGPRLRALAVALRAGGEPSAGARHLDSTDEALLRAAKKLALRSDYGCEGWHRHAELAFESGRGYHAALGTSRAGSRLAIKGAPELVLQHCTELERDGQRLELGPTERAALGHQVQQLAARGLRLIAVAERMVEPPGDVTQPPVGLCFKGFIAFSDPVRPSARAALGRLSKAGVASVMITGDHPSTALAIAEELGLGGPGAVLTGAELAALGEAELDARLDGVSVFARVTPTQKVRIVRALQRRGQIVAMVGDGANDAPAIRVANVGIAIGGHTAAVRAAADVVLVDERIETIVHAVTEGRAVWAAVRDAVAILVGGNFGEIGFTVLGGLIDGRPPLHPRQLLIVNLLTDVAPAMAIALRPPTAQVMERLASEGPEASLGAPLSRDIAARAAITALGAGSAWLVGRLTGGAERARTVGLVALVGTQLGQTLVSGGLTVPVVLTSLGSVAALGVVVQTPGLSHFFGCRPIGPVGWVTALSASAVATGVAVLAPRGAEQLYRTLASHPLLPQDVRRALAATLPEGTPGEA